MIENRLFRRALVFTFLAHGAAMLGMLVFLIPLLPGGIADDLARVEAIAASPFSYRAGWFGWQVTAVSDLVLAYALVWSTPPKTRARSLALASAAFTVLAVIPDQTAQLLLVTRGFDLAVEGAAYHDPTDFLTFEDAMFPLTSGWAALLYTLGAIGWVLVLREVGIWSRLLARLSGPLLALFVVISLAPILPLAIRPGAKLIGGGNALAFTLLEVWFVVVYRAASKERLATSVPK